MEMARLVRGEWPSQGVTFETSRGSFDVPRDMLERVEMTGDDFEIRRHFARNLPDMARADRREKLPGGSLRIHWRIIRVVELTRY